MQEYENTVIVGFFGAYYKGWLVNGIYKFSLKGLVQYFVGYACKKNLLATFTV